MQRITFDRDGTIDIFNASQAGHRIRRSRDDVARYQPGRPFHLAVTASPGPSTGDPSRDREGNWSVFIDSKQVWTGPYFTREVRPFSMSIRFTLLGRSMQYARVDNVRLTLVDD
jgi:hypothetical protein